MVVGIVVERVIRLRQVSHFDPPILLENRCLQLMDESGNQYVTGFGKSVPRELNQDSSTVFSSAACKNNEITLSNGCIPPTLGIPKMELCMKTLSLLFA